MSENEIAQIVVHTCYRIHLNFGPGLFESVYDEAFAHEWNKTGLGIVRQRGVKVIYDGVDMGIGFVPDIVLENKVIVELKSVEMLAEVHYKQLLTYLRLTNLRLGLLVNFNIPMIKNGIHRIANNL